jgi:hypothetical protein
VWLKFVVTPHLPDVWMMSVEGLRLQAPKKEKTKKPPVRQKQRAGGFL